MARRAWLGTAVVLLGLGGLEGVARVIEPSLATTERSIPDARPGKHPDLEARAAQARLALALPPDPVSGWRAPQDGGLYRNNELGLRGAEVPTRTAGELRLVTLGDSSVWGWGVGYLADTEDLDDPSDALLARYTRNLRALVAETTALGARPAVLLLPAAMDLDPAPPPETVLEYREALRMVAAEAGAPLIDGPVWFRTHGATLGHFLDQVHPSAPGHAMLGEAVAESLVGDRP